MDLERNVLFDVEAYEARVRSRPCFICAIVAGDPDYALEQIVYEDDRHLAFLARYPTMPGYVLVSPKRHVEHVVRDLDEDDYHAIMGVVRKVALAVEAVVPSERTYLLSLGSRQGNAHLHWHVAPLPPGTPYRKQQFHALMSENGTISWSQAQAEELAARLRAALA
ncbi:MULTISPECIES: HIT family protein [unclassified Nonomuraea]|uniref:HIT family protein n=1 Tax=unclassified Nonomuraea TaxID=2593643 RepID=UPI0035BF3602